MQHSVMGAVLSGAWTLHAVCYACLCDAAQHGCQRHSSLDVVLRVHENFCMDYPVCPGLLQVRSCELVEVLQQALALSATPISSHAACMLRQLHA